MSFLLEGVTFRHGKSTVLRGLNFEVHSGERLAIMGPSGIGKSTLLYLLGLLWNPRGRQLEGCVTYRDARNTVWQYRELEEKASDRLRREDFGFALQSSYLLPHFNCIDNIAIPLGIRGDTYPDRTAVAIDLLKKADLVPRSHALPGDLAGGERRRVNVLRAIVHEPRVVFADEPVSALDEANKQKVLELLGRWHRCELQTNGSQPQSRTLVLVCHDKSIAEKWCDRILWLEPGYQHRVELLTNC